MQTVGIVISGGSSKGAYQVGFFKALKKYCASSGKIRVQSISATSIGVINSYAFLCNKLEMIEELWTQINVSGIWSLRKKIKEEDSIRNVFSCLIEEGDCIYQDFFIALSEMSIMTAQHFNLKGTMMVDKIALAQASIIIPMLTGQPQKYNEKYYFDGGVTNNIPIEPLLTKKFDWIIVVHFTPGYKISQEALAPDSNIIYIDMTCIDGFIKGNFDFRQEHVVQMIKDGQLYTENILDKYLSQQTYFTPIAFKGFYYYLSAGRLLSILNMLLMLGQTKRIVLIKQFKKVLDFITKG